MFKKISSHKMIFIYSLFFLLFLVSFTLPFVAGIYSHSAFDEKLCNYISNTISECSPSSNYLALTVSKTNESGVVLSDESEFYSLYGVFRQYNATFASGYNIHKNYSVYIPSLSGGVNYSIFYNGKDASVPYEGHYKHWYYPIEYMFPSQRLYDISEYMIYISESQARELLKKSRNNKNNNDFSSEDYKSLIKTKIDIVVNNSSYECVIGNIFYERNYYYDALNSVLGNFICCAYYCPGFSVIDRANIYFLNRYPYQNNYFLNHIRLNYPNKKYNVDVIDFNFPKDVLDKKYITSFYYYDFNQNVLMISIVIASAFILNSILVLLIIIFKLKYRIRYVIGFALAVIIPYVSFFIVSCLLPYSLTFSNFSIKLYVYQIIFVIALLFVYYSINILSKRSKKRGS